MNTSKLFHQTQAKTKGNVEIKKTKSREHISFNIPLQVESGEKMLRLASLEKFDTFFNTINETNNFQISKPIERETRYSLFWRIA